MPKYRQITSGERYVIAALRKRKLSLSEIARHMGRSPSTISREIRRNLSTQGRYSPPKADSYAVARRRRSRRNSHFSPDDWVLVEHLVGLDWSPEQVAGWLALHGLLSISHKTIYLRVWRDKHAGGELWTHMRQATKRRRKRYRSHDSRGRLAGKRHISERPPEVETRQVQGHWEIDSIMGDDHGRHSALTVVERKTGFLQMGKLTRPRGRRHRSHHRAHQPATRPLQDDHRRQRHGVPQLQAHRGGDRRAVLLRHPAPLLGARHQREH